MEMFIKILFSSIALNLDISVKFFYIPFMEAKVISEIKKALNYLKENQSQISGDTSEYEDSILFAFEEIKKIEK